MITREEIDIADLEQLGQISWDAIDDLRKGTVTPKESNAISNRVRKRLKAIKAELKNLSKGNKTHASPEKHQA